MIGTKTGPLAAAATIVSLSLMSGVPAHADETAADTPAQTSKQAQSLKLEEVTVTGSRIKRAGFDTLEAAFITDAAEIERRAYTNVAQALEAEPAFAGSDATPVRAAQAANGIGQTFVNLFGLGSQRTLTLVNGRRYVSSNSVTNYGRIAASPGSQVDLNVIPAGLVERVETIAIGGAPVYGADAIAGTVNIILKDNFEGIQASAQYGTTERGDNGSQNYRLLLGNNFAADRGNAVFSLEHNKEEGLILSERIATFPFFFGNPADTGPQDGIPALRLVDDFRLGFLTEGGLPYDPNNPVPGLPVPGLFGVNNYVSDANGSPLQFARNGDLVPFNPGSTIEDAGLGAPVFTQGGDGWNPALHYPLATPLERTLFNTIAHFDVTPSIRLSTEASFAHTSGIEQSAIYQFAAPVLLGGPLLTFSVDNPFLTTQARDALVASGFSTFAVNRNFNDVVDRTPAESTTDIYRIVGGIEGKLGWFEEPWSWNLSYNYGRSRNSSTRADIDPVKLANAIDAVDDGTGNIVCASGATGCVPINLFGQNAFSDAAADYVTDIGEAISRNTMQVANANLAGRLPFGISEPIAFNVGYEHRKEDASFEPDAIQRAGTRLLGGADGAGPFASRGFKTDEAYAEIVTPLISTEQNFRAIKSLSVEGAMRYVDNSIAGSATTWSAGARFAPRLSGWGEGLMFRGVYTQAIRAPAITELFSPAQLIGVGVQDPCDSTKINNSSNPARRLANCTAALAEAGAGTPDTFNSTTDAVSAFGTISGNQNLKNEQAKSWSAGLVYQPSAHPEFRIALDWSNISLRQGIETLGINEILATCYDSDSFPSEPACDSFHRLTAAEAEAQQAAGGTQRNIGDIADGFTSGYINVAGIDFAGLAAATAYNTSLRGGELGALRFGLKLFFVDKFNFMSSTGAPVADQAGEVGTPRYRITTNMGYSLRRLDADLQAVWRSATVNSKLATIETTPLNDYPSYTLFNGTLGYQFTEKVKMQLAVLNLLDEPMPDAARARITLGQFDPFGRRYFLTLYANF